MGIQRQPGTNTIAVTDSIKRLLPQLPTELPPAVKMDVLYDRSDTIRESYHDVQFTMVLTLGLIVMVIFLFLRNISATIIPSLALPFSIVGTFAVMYLLDYSLDNLSMMALILSIGFVVDDAIVMLENIVRHMEMGEKPLAASLIGSKGNWLHHRLHDVVAGRRLHSRCSSWAASSGALFKEFAVTICCAILISGVVSVTLTPMLCSRFLRSPHEQKRSRFYNVTERFFEGWLHLYDISLQWVLRYRAITMVFSAAVLVATVWMFMDIPKGFIPDQDTDQMAVVTEAAQGTSYRQMVEYQKSVASIIAADPNVDALTSSVGGTGSATLGGPNYGQLVVHLKTALRTQAPGQRHHRQPSPEACRSPRHASLHAKPAHHSHRRPGHQEPVPVLHAVARQEGTLRESSRELQHELLRKSPACLTSPAILAISAPQIDITIDRDKAGSMQVNAQQIENALYDAYGTRWVSTIYGCHQRVQSPAWNSNRSISPIPTRCSCSTSNPNHEPTDPARYHGHHLAEDWARKRSTTTDNSPPSPSPSI